MDKKVYCYYCKKLDSLNENYICKHELNIKNIDHWYKPYKEFLRKPEEINKFNDCKFFIKRDICD